MLQPLLLGSKQIEEIKRLTALAFEEKILYRDMKAMADAFQRGELPKVRPNQNKTISIPLNYTVTFTVEEHEPNIAFRHLSVSLDGTDRIPSTEAVELLMQHFGFKRRVATLNASGLVYLEEYASNRRAVNVLEPIGN